MKDHGKDVTILKYVIRKRVLIQKVHCIEAAHKRKILGCKFAVLNFWDLISGSVLNLHITVVSLTIYTA
jgi:hypothetical protein